MLDIRLLDKYKAKLDGKTLKQHNDELIKILNQLNMSKKEYNKMIKIINYHDIGKVVQLFQDNIDSTNRDIRHEIISASAKDLTVEERIVILTHHKSLNYIISEEISLLKYDEYYSNLYLSQLKEVEDKLNIEMIDIINEVLKYKINKRLLKNKNAIQLKGMLNYCDHLASGGFTYIDTGFNIGNRFKFSKYTTIQQQAKLQDKDVMMIASTGSGKTEASLFWADNVDKSKNKRIFYILPYTASINAMYKRFKKENISVGMLHSKVQYFLSKELEDEDNKSVKFKYQGFKYFTNQVTVSTIHQVFKAMFNCKFNEMMLSMYKDAIFIIDEIHCYDERQLAIMLTTLKYFKDNYNINICIMSASIPSKLQELIKIELDIEDVLTLTKEENDKIKRHIVNYKDIYIEDDLDLIMKKYYSGEKVIICVNTVAKSQEMYTKISSIIGKERAEDIVLLHSAFNQRDRELIENQLKNKKILIGTQAIEVSLDIDYDVMFTEISPIDSQIQRWGRINRKRIDNLINRKKIYVYDTESTLYDKNIIENTKNVLINLDKVNENDIQKYLDRVYTQDFHTFFDIKKQCEEIFNNIQIGKWDKNYNEMVEFSGASVLPSCFIDEYKKLIENKEYLEANSLIVNISNGKYHYAINDGAIDNQEKVIPYISYNYNDKIGLDFGKFEVN